jgi:uncharacterized delta-60 repeat protein
LRRAAIGACAALLALAAAPAAAAAPGDPDALFGSVPGGTVLLAGIRPAAVVAQSDGRIVVGGESYDGHGGHPMTLARFTAAGALDATFGDRGVATIERSSGLAALVLARNGMVVAAGERLSAAGRREPLVVRLTAAGAAADETPVSLGGEGDALARALVVERDGSIRVVADATHHGVPAVALSSPNGNTRWLTLPERALSAAGAAIDARGRTVVAGTAYDPATGRSDPFVARDGIVEPIPAGLDDMQVRAVALRPNGDAVLVGNARAPLRSVIAAVSVPAGAREPDWSITIPAGPPPADAFATAAVADAHGDVVIGGIAATGDNVTPVLLRLDGTGAVDPTFAAAAQTAGVASVLAAPRNGRLLAAGSVFAGERQQLTLSRYDAGGVPAPPGIPTGP